MWTGLAFSIGMAVRWGPLGGPLAPENKGTGASGRGEPQEGQANAAEQTQSEEGGETPLACPTPPSIAKPAKRARSAR